MFDRANPSRRSFLTKGLALGCSAAASPLLTPVVFASAPWEARLVVIILRGGMDGLDVVRPYGDQALGALRPDTGEGHLDLDGFYALHPGLAPLMPLWQAGQLGFAHAVSTPYRDKRSHFDGQDVLEAGGGFGPGQGLPRDGWLNRMLQSVPGVTAQTAYAIGRENLLLTTGHAPVSNWAPETRLSLSPQAERLLELVYEGDPLFEAAATEALTLTSELEASASDEEDAEVRAMQDMNAGRGGKKGHLSIAEFAVGRLREEARVAAFSLNGWDTHRNQAGSIQPALKRLSEVLLSLQVGLGPIWEKTAVLAMTEFGRTARLNGTAGTDHGTAGAMLMAGGAVRGGRIYGDWPGLEEASLYDRRDLMPTQDVRAYAARVMQGLIGLDQSTLERAIFPGLDMSDAPSVTL